ncbi:MAG: hypothetical protein ACREYF_15930 [Gammaproteobacteria bacterium]
MPAGVIVPELAIVTEDGVKVADVAWMSHEVWTRIKTETAASRAPEICVEVHPIATLCPKSNAKQRFTSLVARRRFGCATRGA